MTPGDGFDMTVSNWLREEAEWTTPGYLDEVLATTIRTRQRPAWSSLERWLPVATTLRTRLVPIRPAAVAVLVVVTLILVLVAIALSGFGRPRVPVFDAQRNGQLAYFDGSSLELAAADGTVSSTLTVPTGASAIAWAPDGRHFAYRTDEPKPSIVVVTADGKTSLTVAQGTTVANYGRLAWSPDGRTLAFSGFVDLRPVVIGVDVDGRNLGRIGQASPNEDGFRFDPAWSPDGRWVAFFDRDRDNQVAIYVVHPDGTGEQRLRTLPANSNEHLAWSPNPGESRLLYATSGTVRLYDVAADRDIAVGQGFWATWSPDGTRIAWWGSQIQVVRIADLLNHAPSLVFPFPGFSGNCNEHPEFNGRVICSPAQWSPDGVWLYGPDPTGTSIVVGRADGTGQPWTIHLDHPIDMVNGSFAQISWQPVAP